jgi:hypothetical protein
VKRIIATTAVALIVAVTGCGVAMAYPKGTPERDIAEATMRLASAKPTVANCTGEDGDSYVTYQWNWAGNETDALPGSTDYNLTGTLEFTNLEWTINLKTQRGLLRGTATLYSKDTTSSPKTYSGPLVLLTNGLPNTTTEIGARGWIEASTFSAKGVPDGGTLFANVILTINPGFSASGGFGSTPYAFPNYAMTSNNLIC